jgi:hypothetical protein
MPAIFAPISREEVSHGQESETTHCTRGSRRWLVLIASVCNPETGMRNITTRPFTVLPQDRRPLCPQLQNHNIGRLLLA